MNARTVKILGVEVRHLRPPVRDPEPFPPAPANLKYRVHKRPAPAAKYREGQEYPEELLSQVCFDAELSVGQVVRGGNTKTVVAARRRFAILAIRQGYSSVRIASVLHRHHTSVLYLTKT